MTTKKPDWLAIKRAFWNDSTGVRGGEYRYGLETKSGDRSISWLAPTVDEAKAKAEELARSENVPCERLSVSAPDATRRAARRQEEAASGQARAARRAFVCDAEGEGPSSVDDEEPVLSEVFVAVPSMGGILAELPLSSGDRRRFPAEVVLPVTKAVEKLELESPGAAGWVVVQDHGKGCAMTIDEAYERGLHEAPNWIPDLTGSPSVPGEGDIAEQLATNKTRGPAPGM